MFDTIAVTAPTREARQGAQRVAGEQHDVGGRLDVRDRGEGQPPDHRERRQRRHQREHARRRAVALVPGEADRHCEREKRNDATARSCDDLASAHLGAAACRVASPPAPSRIRATSVEK